MSATTNPNLDSDTQAFLRSISEQLALLDNRTENLDQCFSSRATILLDDFSIVRLLSVSSLPISESPFFYATLSNSKTSKITHHTLTNLEFFSLSTRKDRNNLARILKSFAHPNAIVENEEKRLRQAKTLDAHFQLDSPSLNDPLPFDSESNLPHGPPITLNENPIGMPELYFSPVDKALS